MKSLEPLITVIVPVYRVVQYLDRCVQSIVNQTYTKLEIILVDDGSPDDCPAMCDAWAKKDNRIRVIHKQNGGLSDARNAGLKQAQGRYIAFVDSDDWIDRRFLDYLYLAIKRTGAELSACDFAVVPDGESFSRNDEQELTVESASSYDALNDLTSGVRFRAVAWNKLYLADVLKNEQFEYGRIHEDEFFTYRIIDKAQKLAYVDIPLYCYRQRESSIMSSFSVNHIDAIDAFYERACYFAEKYPDIARKDKLTTCITCINMYCEIDSKGCKESAAAKKRIKDIRRKLHFTKDDWKAYSSKQKMYLILSTRWFIGLFSKFKCMKGKKRWQVYLKG